MGTHRFLRLATSFQSRRNKSRSSAKSRVANQFSNEGRESYVEAGTDVKADFCLRARGDSMVGARILDGDLVFIQRDAELESGQIYAVAIDDEATLKRVYYDAKSQVLQLMAENSKYAPLIYTGETLDHVHILGKAVAFQSDVI